MRHLRTKNYGAFCACAASAVVVAAMVACSSSSSSPDEASDTDAGLTSTDATTDVGYMGVTHGGGIPSAPPYVAPDAGSLTYDASLACCTTRIAVSGTGTESSVQVMGDLPPFDGPGLSLRFASGYWAAPACIPLGEAVQYRVAITSADGDGGQATQYTIDPDVSTVVDGNGVEWNVVSLTACSELPDGGIVETLADSGTGDDSGDDAADASSD